MKKILSVVLAIAFAVSLNNNVTKAVETNAFSSSVACTNITNNLWYGKKDSRTDNEVTLLRNFLTSEGYTITDPAGTFGRGTDTALKSWQSKKGIVSSGTRTTTGYGSTGPLTRKKIRESTCQIIDTPTLVCLDLTKNLQYGARDRGTDTDVVDLQNFLKSQDYFTVKTTNFFGLSTQNALKEWQRDMGIVSSGTPRTTGYGAAGPATRAKIKEASCAPVVVVTPDTVPVPNPQNPTMTIVVASTTDNTLIAGQTYDFKISGPDDLRNVTVTITNAHGYIVKTAFFDLVEKDTTFKWMIPLDYQRDAYTVTATTDEEKKPKDISSRKKIKITNDVFNVKETNMVITGISSVGSQINEVYSYATTTITIDKMVEKPLYVAIKNQGILTSVFRPDQVSRLENGVSFKANLKAGDRYTVSVYYTNDFSGGSRVPGYSADAIYSNEFPFKVSTESSPVFSGGLSDGSLNEGPNQIIGSFEISAKPTGDIGWKMISFEINKNLQLLLGNESSTDFALYNNMGVRIDGKFLYRNQENFSLRSTVESKVVFIANTEQVIPAGTSVRYELKSTIGNIQEDNSYLKIDIGKGGYSPYDPSPFQKFDTLYGLESFVWTDRTGTNGDGVHSEFSSDWIGTAKPLEGLPLRISTKSNQISYNSSDESKLNKLATIVESVRSLLNSLVQTLKNL